MKVLIIVPAFNEGKNILNTVNEIKKINIENIFLDYVVINDGSTDSTKQVCEKNNINYIDLPINLGIGGAVQTGYKYAKNKNYDVAIQFDGDAQHDSTYLELLLEQINNGYDMAIGSRFIGNISKFKSTKSRRIGIKFLSFLIKIATGAKISDPTSGFRAVNKKIIEIFSCCYPVDYAETETNAMLAKLKYKIVEVPVNMRERKHGVSSISPIKSLYFAIKVPLSIIFTSIIYGGMKK